MSKNHLKNIDEAWLGLDNVGVEIFNPMSLLKPSDEDFHLKLAYIMTRPEYLSFITSKILNIQLLPLQSLILNEL